jgi:hypothetical protein
MPQSQLEYEADRSGLFPEFFRREVARFSFLTLEQFDDQPGDEQSRQIAFFNLSMRKDRLLQGGLHGG